MITRLIPSAQRGLSQWDWLKSYHSFSFNDFFRPDMQQFGPLRVLNEDWISPDSGFGMHPHRDMEIITYVLSGTLDHADSTGSRGSIGAGEVQRMTAGTGIFHSEMNASLDTPVHMLQIWFLPDRRGYPPSYEQKQFTREERMNTLLNVASNTQNERGVFLNQDVRMYISALEKGKSLAHGITEGRGVYLFLIEGELSTAPEKLTTGDALQTGSTGELYIKAEEQSEFVLFDMKM